MDFPFGADTLSSVEELLDPAPHYVATRTARIATIRAGTDPSGARVLHVRHWPGTVFEKTRLLASISCDPVADVRYFHRVTPWMADVVVDNGVGMPDTSFRAQPDDLWDEPVGYHACQVVWPIRGARLYGFAVNCRLSADDAPGTPEAARSPSPTGRILGHRSAPRARVCSPVLSHDRRTNGLTGLPWLRLVLDTIPRLTVAVAGDVPCPPVPRHFCGTVRMGGVRRDLGHRPNAVDVRQLTVRRCPDGYRSSAPAVRPAAAAVHSPMKSATAFT
jgi:hypothetical protein